MDINVHIYTYSYQTSSNLDRKAINVVQETNWKETICNQQQIMLSYYNNILNTTYVN
jgi:hypothetical protein